MSLIIQSVAGPSDDPDAAGVGTVLVYELSTSPDPVRVSPATGTVERADLVIVGSRHLGSGIDARKLTVYIPTGNASAELALDLTGITAQTSLPGWTPASDPTNQRIVFAPPSGVATIGAGQGVTIQLDGIRINRVVGSAPVVIELEYREAGTSAWKTDRTTLGVGKFPAGFFLRNLIAKPLVIENGGTATLTWEASTGATYKLLYDRAEIDVTNRREYDVTNVAHTTVFYLRAIAQSGNDTVERTLSTTVTVNEPDLVVRNLTVQGTANLAMNPQTLPTPPESMWGRWFIAPTAGFLIANTTRSDGKETKAGLQVVVGDVNYHATATSNPGTGMGVMGNSAILPAPKGARCDYYYDTPAGGLVPNFQWVALGPNTPVRPTAADAPTPDEPSASPDAPSETPTD